MASVTRGFSDSPLSTTLILSSTSDEPNWNYLVTFPDDDTGPLSGIVDQLTSLPLQFTGTGIHRIAVTFSAGATTAVDTLFVSVNDPDFSSPQLQVSSTPPIHGMAFGGGFLYTAGANIVRRHAPQTVQVLDSVALQDTLLPKRFGGVSISPEGEIYVISDARREILTFTSPPLAVRDTIQVPLLSAQAVIAEHGDVLYAGLTGGVSVLDLDDEQVLAQRPFDVALSFSLAPNGNRLLVAEAAPDHLIHGLNGLTLIDEWTVSTGSVIPSLVLVSRDGATVHALGTDSADNLYVFVIRTSNGEVIRRLAIEPCPFCFLDLGPNSAALLGDFPVFATANGLYILDPTTGIPIHRQEAVCCNVASDPVTGTLYASSRSELAVFRTSLTNN